MAQDERTSPEQDFLYQPDIDAPEREAVTIDGSPADENISRINEIAQEEIPDIILSWAPIFEEHQQHATKLLERARQLMDLSIADIGGYVGDAPPYIREYITDLTGIVFPTEEEDPGATSPVFTLPYEIKKCIFRAAGYYDSQQGNDMVTAAATLDPDALAKKINTEMGVKSYIGKHGILMYGIRLLVIVLKLSYVIMVYYTIGYLCGFFRGKLKFGYKKKIAGKKIGFEFKIGDKIAALFRPVENKLLSIVGYGCRQRPSVTPVECPVGGKSAGDLEKRFSFRDIECCTTKPIFFDNRQFYTEKLDFSHCLKAAVNFELDPVGYVDGTICAYENLGIEREATPEEREKAKVVADYLIAKGESRYGIDGYQNIGPLNNAINNAESALLMSNQVGSLFKDTTYRYTNYPKGCFGYEDEKTTTPEEDLINIINQNAGKWLKKTADPPIVITKSQFAPVEFVGDFLKALDQGIGNLVDIADRVVTGTANLTMWGSSQQLCCWVYLLVFAATMIRRAVKTGLNFCNDKMVKCYECGGSGQVNKAPCPVCLGRGEIRDSQAFAQNLRAVLKVSWATEIKKSTEVQQFVAILKVIKAIVDTYIRSLKRPVLLQGLRLPLQEMWELVKLTIANGLAQFVDVILSPIDAILSGLQGIPEMRLALANECFGIDKLFDFIVCNINNLKFSLVNSVMRLIDFTISDVTLINDIYLCRARLATLESLSRLLGSLINLILGLKDCYNPEDVVNEIVNKQTSEQYNQIRDLNDLLGEAGVSFDDLNEMRRSLVGNQFPVSDEERAALDRTPGSIAQSFGAMGIADDIIVRSLKTFDTITEGTQVTSAEEFLDLLNKNSGVSIAEVKESLLHIFDILRGA